MWDVLTAYRSFYCLLYSPLLVHVLHSCKAVALMSLVCTTGIRWVWQLCLFMAFNTSMKQDRWMLASYFIECSACYKGRELCFLWTCHLSTLKKMQCRNVVASLFKWGIKLGQACLTTEKGWRVKVVYWGSFG